jgi:hypothetical protein
MSNQFGFDRDGFRVFVLSAAPRRDILLGKNLALAPVGLGITLIMLMIIQFACPLRADHLAAMLPQFVSMFLLFCLLMNILSIYAPVYIAPGTLKAANPRIATVLLQLAMVLVLFPLTQAATLAPLGIEMMMRLLGWGSNVPICLFLSLMECAVIVVIYALTLTWQGRLLQAREQSILEVVTNRAI